VEEDKSVSRRFYKVMLGQRSKDATICRAEGFIGTDFDVHEDLSQQLPENWREFNEKWIPYFMQTRTSKVSAGLAAGQLWVVSKGISQGDIVLSPTGIAGELVAGEVISDYEYQPTGPLPHRRRVKWLPGVIKRDDTSAELRGGLGFAGTVCTLDPYGTEILGLIGETPIITSTDPTIEDPSVFAMEKYLEEFLVANWNQTEFGKEYDIFTEDGEIVGRQYQTDTGPMDILAISKDKTKLLVVELKKGRASDSVVGQVQRYMGYVLELLAEPNQEVHGVIIALEDDLKIQRALKVTRNIDFYRYIINFRLEKTSK
jgi:restriction system protein